MDKETKRLLWFVAFVMIMMIVIGLLISFILKRVDLVGLRRRV